MKKRFLFLALCALCFSMVSFAQITTGETSAKKIKSGNRAQAGDFGLYVGGTTEMFKDLFNDDLEVKALPLINFKYMYSDNVEFRLGMEFYKKTGTVKSEIEEGKDADKVVTKSKSHTIESRNYVYPGVAYHFSKRNLLDVYVGAELPMGWERYALKNSSEFDGDDHTENVSRGTFNIGLGAFIGLQAYIANLPLAIGFEYGISSMLHAGLRYKHVVTDEDGKDQTYYTNELPNNPNFDGEQYDSLKIKQGEIGSQFRFTLTYYFK